ncbi:MAG: type II toxin-antitoxin system VapC family toxin [Methylovulum sp.]|uniref:type II toxin-antitoxin system VapC family toxin n=1 Tax=Methylovulum sp. TaxID=1916980 RepID=UPI00260B60CE|nr:type II toxin-antitoxin system VapC family toxin [Methylovulum sp.]MDD2724926.1 type II toxin-antitoxin system VapC family toxin [Methylovulum sp.]MDD5124296.1 type II toxin-antitoxin system VapC family toxin [Methylovulum sp.]
MCFIKHDPQWLPWARATLTDALLHDQVFINPLIYAELSIMYQASAQLDQVLNVLGIERAELPWEAAYLAGQAFVRYRRQGGGKTSPLPDFYIGAHAQSAGFKLLTRDVKRYRTYFPGVLLITPDSHPTP